MAMFYFLGREGGGAGRLGVYVPVPVHAYDAAARERVALKQYIDHIDLSIDPCLLIYLHLGRTVHHSPLVSQSVPPPGLGGVLVPIFLPGCRRPKCDPISCRARRPAPPWPPCPGLPRVRTVIYICTASPINKTRVIRSFRGNK